MTWIIAQTALRTFAELESVIVAITNVTAMPKETVINFRTRPKESL